MTRFLPPCDIQTLQTIESYAPHLLTPADRYALRMHKAASVKRRVPVAALVLACSVAGAVALAAVVLA